MSVLQVYMADREKPLPCYDEVLLCSSSTTLEEVVPINITDSDIYNVVGCSILDESII